MKSAVFQIVILEDNRADLHIMRHSILDAVVDCNVIAFSDGAEAIGYIDDATSIVPELMILDLNIPGVDGPSVLNRIRGNPRWSHVPVFVFTASQSPGDMARAKSLGSDRYLLKPMDLNGFLKFGRDIKEWLEDRARISASGF
jgi:CheY-like chemotaxis protein